MSEALKQPSIDEILFDMKLGRWATPPSGQVYSKILPEGFQLSDGQKTEIISRLQALAQGYPVTCRIDTKEMPVNKEGSMSVVKRARLVVQHRDAQFTEDGSIIENRPIEKEFEKFVYAFGTAMIDWRRSQPRVLPDKPSGAKTGSRHPALA